MATAAAVVRASGPQGRLDRALGPHRARGHLGQDLAPQVAKLRKRSVRKLPSQATCQKKTCVSQAGGWLVYLPRRGQGSAQPRHRHGRKRQTPGHSQARATD